MAAIILENENVDGESSVTATVGTELKIFTDKVDAIGIHDFVEGAYGSSRGVAHEIQLVRYRDRASPKLAEKCASGTGIGEVNIYIFKNDGGVKLVMKLTLAGAYVSRIEYGTADSMGTAFQRHNGDETLGAHGAASDLQDVGRSVNDARGYSRKRARPKPLYMESPGTPTSTEVERVWLNFSAVTWMSASGNLTGSFNNNTGAAVVA